MTPGRPIPGVPLPVFRPGLVLAVPFLAGIAAADASGAPPGHLAAGLASVAALFAAAALLRLRAAGRAALLAAAFLAGALRMSVHLDLPEDHLARFPPPAGDTAIRGIVVSEPVFWKRPSLREPPPGAPAPGSFGFDVEAERMLEPGPRAAAGLFRVSVYSATLPSLHPGDRVVARGILKPPREPTNPGQPDRAARLRREGLHRVMTVADPSRIEVLGPAEGTGLLRTVAACRRRLLEALGVSLRPDAAAFLGALLLGAQGDLSDDVETAFRRTGTYHLIAISGFHLMLLWGVLAWCFGAAGWSGRPPQIVTLAVLAGYTLLTGLLASAVRSFLMVAAVIGADLAGRRRDSLSSLAFAALAIAAADPVQVFDAGFQLSFLAVFGILWLYPPLRAFASAPPDPLASLRPPGRGRILRGWLASQARDGVCVSMAAWLVTAPRVAALSHLITPVTNAANLVLCPLVAVELVGAAVKTATGFAGGPVDAAVGLGLEGIYDAMVLSARALAALPGAWIPVAGFAAPGLCLYAGGLAAWVRLCRHPRPRAALAGVALVVAALGLSRAGPSPPAGFRITTLDVGQGSAHVCEFPDGGVIVIDAGSSSYADPARSVVAPYLWSRGRTAVDLLVLSHADVDHVNGAPFLLENFRVAAVAVSPTFDRLTEGAGLVRKAESEGTPVIRAPAGGRIEGIPGAEIRILGPDAGPAASRLSGNGASLLVRVQSRGGSALFTGDIDAKGLAALPAASIPGLAADAITVPHHGSPGSRSVLLVRSAGARFALVSARRGFAADAVLRDYRDAGAAVLATWKEGAIRMEKTLEGWRVRSFEGSGRDANPDNP
jgi:competence protein ComEC